MSPDIALHQQSAVWHKGRHVLCPHLLLAQARLGPLAVQMQCRYRSLPSAASHATGDTPFPGSCLQQSPQLGHITSHLSCSTAAQVQAPCDGNSPACGHHHEQMLCVRGSLQSAAVSRTAGNTHGPGQNLQQSHSVGPCGFRRQAVWQPPPRCSVVSRCPGIAASWGLSGPSLL